jgi:acetyl esterase/lipase
MRKTSLALVLFFNIILCLSAKNGYFDDKVIISGTIANAKFRYIKIDNHHVNLDNKGHFELRFDLKKPAYFSFWHGNDIPLFLTPGDRVEITLDAEDFYKTLKFKGKGAEPNNYLADLARLREEQTYGFSQKQLFSLEEADFTAQVKSLKSEFQQVLNTYLRTHKKVDRKFAKFEQARIDYSWASFWLQYSKRHKQYTKKKTIKLSEDYNDYLSQLDFNDQELMPLREYRSFLNDYINIKAEEALKTDKSLEKLDNQLNHAAYRTVLKTFDNQKIRSFFLYGIMQKQIDDYGIKNIDDLIEKFKEDCADERYKSEIDRKYKRCVEQAKGHTVRVYKRINNYTLDAHIYPPPDSKPGDKLPALVFFHGGGWSYGIPEWCMGLCENLPYRGVVVISIEYRLVHRHGTTPLEAVKDSKSAIRWVRQHANELGIDPDKIIAAGVSSGGQLAAATATLKEFDEPDEDMNISSVPNALMLFSAVVNTTLNPWMEDILGDRAHPKDISPVHNIHPGVPPTIIFHGRFDKSAPFWTIEVFNREMKRAGNQCEVHAYGGDHFFMNDEEIRQELMTLTEKFLASLGLIKNNGG